MLLPLLPDTGMHTNSTAERLLSSFTSNVRGGCSSSIIPHLQEVGEESEFREQGERVGVERRVLLLNSLVG
jgi:hypothetical protein